MWSMRILCGLGDDPTRKLQSDTFDAVCLLRRVERNDKKKRMTKVRKIQFDYLLNGNEGNTFLTRIKALP